nr:LOW QUALITY PROTEIN: somatomedin-B and thrombospondin type-1 domain-containing protein [Paramormyrops kingsleyae]
MDRRFDTCFCDEACRRTRDCCFDYRSLCPVQLCVVDPLSYWSGCSQPCQVTFRERPRRVQQEPSRSPAAPAKPAPPPPAGAWSTSTTRGRAVLWTEVLPSTLRLSMAGGGAKRTYKEIRQAKAWGDNGNSSLTTV